MARALKWLASSLAVTALLAGCGQSSLSATKPAPAPDVETHLVPPKQPREVPRLIAPPPAYGNKIVMAEIAPRVSPQ